METKLHVYPLDDLRPHITDGTQCWCNPQDDGEIVTHNALDQRERYETGELKPS